MHGLNGHEGPTNPRNLCVLGLPGRPVGLISFPEAPDSGKTEHKLATGEPWCESLTLLIVNDPEYSMGWMLQALLSHFQFAGQ